MKFQVFYCRYSDDFSQEDPIEYKKDEIPELARSVLQNESDFFGVVDSFDTTVQFIVEKRGIWAEVPDRARSGSTGRMLGPEEVVELLKKLPDRFDSSILPGAKFVLWSATDSD